MLYSSNYGSSHTAALRHELVGWQRPATCAACNQFSANNGNATPYCLYWLAHCSAPLHACCKCHFKQPSPLMVGQGQKCVYAARYESTCITSSRPAASATAAGTTATKNNSIVVSSFAALGTLKRYPGQHRCAAETPRHALLAAQQ